MFKINKCNLILKTAILLGTGSLAISSNQAFAGGIYFDQHDPVTTALSGAGYAAIANGPSTTFSNPAGLSRIKGKEFQASLAPTWLDFEVETKEGSTNSGPNTTGIGGMFGDMVPFAGFHYAQDINEDWAFGVSFATHFGLAVDYGSDWKGRYMSDYEELVTAALQPAVSYRINEKWSLGAGLMINYTMLDYDVRLKNVNPNKGDGLVSIEDTDISYQGKLGVLYEMNKNTRFGFVYQTHSDINLSDTPEFSNVGPALQGLLNQTGLANAELDLGVTLPQSVRLSAYHELDAKWTLLADIGWQDWSEFGKVNIAFNTEDGTINADRDGNYKDTYQAALGVQYQIDQHWKIHSGVSFNNSFVDDEDRSPTMPIDDTWRLGLGATYETTGGSQFEFGYQRWGMTPAKFDVDNGPFLGRTVGEYNKLDLNFFSFGYTHSF